MNVQLDLSSFYLTPQIYQLLFHADTSEERSSKVITFPNPMIGEHDEAPMSPIAPQIVPPKCNLLDDFDTFETPSTSSLSTSSKEFAFRAAPSSLSKAL